MGRQPFVWEVQVRREMIEDELARLRELPYAIWREAVGAAHSKKIAGRDGREYTVTASAAWVGSRGDDVRVTVTLRGHRAALQRSFVISPGGEAV